MTRDEELLLEQVTSAHRRRRADGSVRGHPAWFDLDADGRRAAFDATVLQRQLESAMDPDGLTSTARALLSRLSR
jgi:hypothetical protein